MNIADEYTETESFSEYLNTELAFPTNFWYDFFHPANETAHTLETMESTTEQTPTQSMTLIRNERDAYPFRGRTVKVVTDNRYFSGHGKECFAVVSRSIHEYGGGESGVCLSLLMPLQHGPSTHAVINSMLSEDYPLFLRFAALDEKDTIIANLNSGLWELEYTSCVSDMISKVVHGFSQFIDIDAIQSDFCHRLNTAADKVRELRTKYDINDKGTDIYCNNCVVRSPLVCVRGLDIGRTRASLEVLLTVSTGTIADKDPVEVLGAYEAQIHRMKMYVTELQEALFGANGVDPTQRYFTNSCWHAILLISHHADGRITQLQKATRDYFELKGLLNTPWVGNRFD